MNMRNTYNGYKPTLKDYIKTAAIIAFMVFCIAVFVLLSGKPKEVKATAQMSVFVSEYGFV